MLPRLNFIAGPCFVCWSFICRSPSKDTPSPLRLSSSAVSRCAVWGEAVPQAGKARAEYGEGLIARLAEDLGAGRGHGFSARNLRQMPAFYVGWEIWQTPSAKSRLRAVLG